MRFFFFIYVIVYSFLPVDLDSIQILTLQPVRIYLGDLLHAMAIMMVIKAIHSWKSHLASSFEWPYLLFLGWLLVAILSGIDLYGYRAFGETRSVVRFFTFFFPYALFDEFEAQDLTKVVEAVDKMILVSAWTVLIMLCLAPFLGFAQEDFRGVRYLNSNQTFFLALAFSWLLLRNLDKLDTSVKLKAAALFFLAAGILSKNRAAIASLASVLLLYLFFSGRFRVIIVSALVLIGAGMVFAWLAPGTDEEVAVALRGILRPIDDDNFRWRVIVQSAAIEEGMDTFWCGQSYGSYFNYMVSDGQNEYIEELPPHNQFLSLFLKTGVVGVLLVVVTMVWILWQSHRMLKLVKGPTWVSAAITLTMLATASQFFYGLAYDFQVLFGIYLGFGTMIIRVLHRQALETSMKPAQSQRDHPK